MFKAGKAGIGIKVISFLIIQSFLIFDLSWAGNVTTSTITENNCLSPSLQIRSDLFKSNVESLSLDLSDTSETKAVNHNFELLHQIPEAVKALADRDLTGQIILIRVNVNEKSKDGEIAVSDRLDAVGPIARFILSRGGTPLIYGHNGALDTKKKKDDRESLSAAAKYLQEKVLPDQKLVLHDKSIVKDDNKGLQLKKEDIQLGAVNLLENVRFADEYEKGPKRMIFAKALTALYDGIFIFDAFGDIGSEGASVQTVPFLAQEVYVGPEMLKEFNTLESMMTEGVDVLIFGGAKMDKLPLLEQLVNATRKSALIGSGPSAELTPELLAKLRDGNADRVFAAIDYQDNTTKDIGPQTVAKYLEVLDSLKAGQRVVINGTMGFMEGKGEEVKYQAGTKAINEKLIELARRGVTIIVIGGDAGSTAKKYGLDKEKNVISFTGGGVPLKILADETLVGLKALARRQSQLGLAKSDIENVAVNGARGRMGKLYLHSLFYDEQYANMRLVALNGVPLKDLDTFIKTLKSPDSTYGNLFPGIEIEIVEKNETGKYARILVTAPNMPEGQQIIVLDDRSGTIRWDLVGDKFGEEYLAGLGIIETSGQNLESAKSMKTHISAAEDGLVIFGAPSKDEGTPLIVLGVNEENLNINAQVASNASCTTNCIAPVGKVMQDNFGVEKGNILTIHAETSDQSAVENFRGDEPARARPGHRLQSPAKTGAAKLLPKLISGIGPHDGKAIRVGTLTASVVSYTAKVSRTVTVEQVREVYINAAKENPRVFGVGRNLASRDIVKNPHSTIIDLDSIKVSEDGRTVQLSAWYDNEWGYALRGLDMLQAAFSARKAGTMTKDFPNPKKAAKAEEEPKITPETEVAGVAVEGTLLLPQIARKTTAGEVIGLYLTGIKEKRLSRYSQLIIRNLLGDRRFNLKGVVVEGFDMEKGEGQAAALKALKAYAQSIIYSSDLGNIEGLKITPAMTENKEMFLIFQIGDQKRSVRVLTALPQELGANARVIDTTKISYSFDDMIGKISNALYPLNAELFSTTISMSTRPEGSELLDSGKGVSVPANILPVKIKSLDEKGVLYQAFQAPVNSGSYLYINFSFNGKMDKELVFTELKNKLGKELAIEDNTSNHFAANSAKLILDKSNTLVMYDKAKDNTTVSLFFLVNEELYAVNKALEEIASVGQISKPKLSVPSVIIYDDMLEQSVVAPVAMVIQQAI